MSELVLVDLDNLVPDMPAGQCMVFDARARLARSGTPQDWPDDEDPAITVVIAANAYTIDKFGFTRGWLAAIARSIEANIDVDGVRLEVAMVPSTPEAADDALVQLLHHAPAEGAPVRWVRVATHDKGLLTRVGAALAERGSWAGPRRVGVVSTWKAEGPSWTRTAPSPMPLAEPSSVEREGRAAVAVDTPGLAAAAAAELPDVLPGVSLPALARVAARQPLLLTQFGPTRTSVRGMARVRLGPDDALGPSHPDDGLVLLGQVEQGIVQGRLEAGPRQGMVWCDGVALASTRLPAQVLHGRRGRANLWVRQDEPHQVLDDEHVLDALVDGEPLGEVVVARVAPTGGGLVCKTQDSQAWAFLLEASGGFFRPHSKVWVPSSATLALAHEVPVRVAAAQVAGERELVFVSASAQALFTPVELYAHDTIAPETIGRATDARGRAVLVLAGAQALRGQLRALPIQAHHTTAVARLPLMVPA